MRKSKPVVCITTYQMVTFKGPRAAITADIMQLVSGKTWGLMLLDEVHVAPANAFKQVGRPSLLPACSMAVRIPAVHLNCWSKAESVRHHQLPHM